MLTIAGGILLAVIAIPVLLVVCDFLDFLITGFFEMIGF